MPRIKQPFPAFLLSHNNNLNRGYTKNLGLFSHKPYGREVENLQLWKILSIRNVFFWHVLSKKWHKQQKWAILKSFLKHLINSPLQYSFLVLWKYSSQNYGYLTLLHPKIKKLAPIPYSESNFTLWLMKMLFSLNRTLTTSLPFLGLDLQPYFSVT